MELTVATANTTWLVICQFLLFKIKIYCVAFLAIQSFMNTLFNPSMFQQPQQVRTGGPLQPQVQLPQQKIDSDILSNSTFTSVGPVLSFATSSPSSLQTSISLHPHPTTAYTPVTTVQYVVSSHQRPHCKVYDNSNNETSSLSSQVRWIYFTLLYLYCN